LQHLFAIYFVSLFFSRCPCPVEEMMMELSRKKYLEKVCVVIVACSNRCSYNGLHCVEFIVPFSKNHLRLSAEACYCPTNIQLGINQDVIKSSHYQCHIQNIWQIVMLKNLLGHALQHFLHRDFKNLSGNS
jgi:hypothetical protein